MFYVYLFVVSVEAIVSRKCPMISSQCFILSIRVNTVLFTGGGNRSTPTPRTLVFLFVFSSPFFATGGRDHQGPHFLWRHLFSILSPYERPTLACRSPLIANRFIGSGNLVEFNTVLCTRQHKSSESILANVGLSLRDHPSVFSSLSYPARFIIPDKILAPFAFYALRLFSAKKGPLDRLATIFIYCFARIKWVFSACASVRSFYTSVDAEVYAFTVNFFLLLWLILRSRLWSVFICDTVV